MCQRPQCAPVPKAAPELPQANFQIHTLSPPASTQSGAVWRSCQASNFHMTKYFLLQQGAWSYDQIKSQQIWGNPQDILPETLAPMLLLYSSQTHFAAWTEAVRNVLIPFSLLELPCTCLASLCTWATHHLHARKNVTGILASTTVNDCR